MIADSANWLVWSKSKDGEKNRNRPTPIERPVNKHKTKDEAAQRGRFEDVQAVSIDELRRRLDAPRALTE